MSKRKLYENRTPWVMLIAIIIMFGILIMFALTGCQQQVTPARTNYLYFMSREMTPYQEAEMDYNFQKAEVKNYAITIYYEIYDDEAIIICGGDYTIYGRTKRFTTASVLMYIVYITEDELILFMSTATLQEILEAMDELQLLTAQL